LVAPDVVFPLIVWSRMFSFLGESNIDELREWTVAEVIRSSTSQVTFVPNTPGNNRKKRAKLADDEDDIGSDLEEAMSFSGSPPVMVGSVDASKVPLSKFQGHEAHESIVDSIFLQWNQLVDLFAEIKARGQETLTIEEADMFFSKVDEKVNYLAVLVGKPSNVEEDDSGINLFTAVRTLTTDIKELKVLLDRRTDKLTERVGTVNHRLDSTTTGGLRGAWAALDRLTERVTTMNVKLESPTTGGLKGAWVMLDIMSRRIGDLMPNQSVPGSRENPVPILDPLVNNRLTNHGQELDALKAKIANLEMMCRLPSAPAPVVTSIDAHALSQTLHELRGDVKRLETQVRNKSVSMGPYHFGCLEDVVDFVKTHGSGTGYFGQAYTFTILSNLASSGRKDLENKIKFRADLEKAKFGEDLDTNEKIILASMSEQLPPMFGAVDERKLGQALSKVKDLDAWTSADGYLGIAPKIDQVVMEMNVITYDSLRQHYGLDRHVKLIDLFNIMAEATKSFWTHLDGWIRRLYSELKNMSGSTAAEAWGLVTEMLYAILKELCDAKRPGSVAESENDKVQRCSLIVWGCLQEHRMMQDIQTMGFQRHPCVMPSMTNFLFHRRAPTSKVDALEKVVKDLQAESRALKSSNDSLRDSVKKLEAKVKK
jgi:hypothetical protein